MLTFDDLDKHAAGLASLAALLAVIIGPALQSLGAIKQGRSQAMAAFTANLTQASIDETARIIGLAAELYTCSISERKRIQHSIYEAELKVSLIVGTGTIPRNTVSTYLSLIRDGAFNFVADTEMERLIAGLKLGFEQLLEEERVRIKEGR